MLAQRQGVFSLSCCCASRDWGVHKKLGGGRTTRYGFAEKPQQGPIGVESSELSWPWFSSLAWMWACFHRACLGSCNAHGAPAPCQPQETLTSHKYKSHILPAELQHSFIDFVYFGADSNSEALLTLNAHFICTGCHGGKRVLA